jgi:DNA-binding MarR family transcriptional regulator
MIENAKLLKVFTYLSRKTDLGECPTVEDAYKELEMPVKDLEKIFDVLEERGWVKSYEDEDEE